MARVLAFPLLAATLLAASWGARAHAEEWPSFIQAGDAFCTDQADFDDLVAHGHARANSAIETCQTVTKPTRVAILNGQGGTKSMVRIINGPLAYSIGWTNGKLPLAK